MVVGSLTTAAAAVAGNGNLIVALVPVVLVAVLVVVWFAPLRLPLLIVLFLSLALDALDEGPWNSPLAPVGSLLAANLNQSIPVSALAVPGIFVVFLYLLVTHIHRRISGRQIDSIGRAPTAPASLYSLGGSFVAVLALCLVGSMHGGDIQMAKIQVQSFVLVLLAAFLSTISLRGLRDYRILGNLVLVAAGIRALNALWVVHTIQVIESGDSQLAFATTHGDSLLFACATALLIVRFAELPVRRNAVLCAVVLPLLVAGMLANNRRLVWVEIAAALPAMWILSRRSKLKRVAAYALLASLPLIGGYIAVGWNSGSPLFAPIQTFRSVGDAEVDRSTLYRDLENHNLLYTMQFRPLLGTGFGHPFAEPVKMDDISFFKEYRFLPHNSVLGLWAFCGIFGFTGLTIALVVAVYLASRSYRSANTPDERIAALMVISTVLIYLVHCWGDIGFSERKSIFLVGPALALAGQLAVSTGAWNPRPARRRR